MEAIEVTARFDEQGTISPLHFTWKGGIYRVESIGRRWLDESGQHVLVMASDGHFYELIFQSGEGRWYLGQAGAKRTLV